MALEPCRECGAQISTKAAACPHCGAPSSARKRGSRQAVVGWALVIAAIGVWWLMRDDGGRQPARPQQASEAVASAASKASAAAPVASPSPKPATQSARRQAPILDEAVSPITKEDSPKLYKMWGAKGMARINLAFAGAAKIASQSSRCDAVWMTGLSFERSKPPADIVVFATCQNGERFYATEAEAAAGAALESERERNEAIDEGKALLACRDSVKLRLKYPSTMDASLIMGSNTTRAENGAVMVYFTFEAKNDLGATLPHEAYCIVDAAGINVQSIKPR